MKETYLLKPLQTLLVLGLMFTLTNCGNLDNPLEELSGSGGSGGSSTVSVTSITLDPTTLTKKVGDEAVTLTATVKPDDATDKTVTWTSDKESVATVDETGKVTFVGAGTATITATAKDGSGIEGKCTVNVGLLTGLFTVADGKQVQFSQGNLQATYDGSAWTWAFAENQWDCIGNAASNNAINGDGTVSANGTVDLFGWVGASSTWTGAAQYGISNSDIVSSTDTYGNSSTENLKSDWGNTIATGWRTLDIDEWIYLFNTRTTTSGILYAKATVNGVPGLIILPDDWSTSYHDLSNTNKANAAFTTNTITSDDWTNDFDTHGAVFLPAAGYRISTVSSVGTYGYYWTSTPSSGQSNKAQYIQFGSSFVTLGGNYLRNEGHSVRVVHDVVK